LQRLFYINFDLKSKWPLFCNAAATGKANQKIVFICGANNSLKIESMIQRIQSIWLLLAAGFDALTFRLPFYSGDWLRDKMVAVIDLNATSTIWFTILSALVGVLALANIFLFKNRGLQLKLCYLGIVLTLAMLTLYFLEINNFNGGTIAIWAVFYFGILLGYLLAAKGIRNDQKLIRSMDRFR
jgi:hypothetical protein